MKLNPNAVVPTLVHDDKVIIKSTVIMHYVDDLFPDPPLMPRDPYSRSKVHMTTKLMDEYVHNCCTVLTFATANRQNLLKKSAEELEAELAKSPSKARAEVKRQVYHHGLDAPVVVDALRHHQKLLNRIDAAMKEGPYIAGADYSLADIAATPYIWRLTKLRLSRLWDDRPGALANVGRCWMRSYQREYVCGDVHTDYFSIFKRDMRGVYHHCMEKHLHRYLAGFVFRYNHRIDLGYSNIGRTRAAIKGVEGKRLMYWKPR